MLISGIRSHSHAPDAAFIKTVETNLQLLKPGGVFITDGIEESYTEVLRLIASLDGYKVDIIMDEKTHMPISLMIQRKPASGECLTEDEKRQICKKNTYCKNPEDIANLRPDIAIITRVRQELRATLPVSVFRRVNSEHHLSLTQKPETAKELQKSLMRAVAEKELLTHQEWLTPEFAEYLCGRLKERLGLKGLTVSLKPLLPADLQFFAQQGVSTIAARLRKNITFLGASICAEDPIVHEQSKRSVVDAIAWAQWQTSHPKNPEDENTSCQAIKTTFLHTARNISYTENPILKAEDIERIAKATTQNLRETLARSQHQTR